MLTLKYITIPVFTGLLAASCAYRSHDSILRQQIVGTWSQGPSAQTTLLADGRFHSDVKRIDVDSRIDGKWDVKGGALVISTKHVSNSYKPSATHMESVSGSPNPTLHKVLALDSTRLTVLTEDPQMGAKTNVWERK